MTDWPGNNNMSDIIDNTDPPPLTPSTAAGLSARTSVKDLQGDPTNPSSHFHGALFEHLFTDCKRKLRILHPFRAFAMDD